MVDEIGLRNFINRGNFRLEVTPGLWKTLYEVNREGKPSNVITVRRNGVLKGYASYLPFVRGKLTALGVLDINADTEDVLAELIDAVVERAKAEDVDIIYFRKGPSSDDRVFDKKGFTSFIETVITIALLNPRELLRAFSEDNVSGPYLRLNIKGLEPVAVIVGKQRINVVSESKPDLEIFTDSETFLKLFFNQTTVLKEFVKGKVKVSDVLKLRIVKRFFDLIRQEKWYIPFGDWT